MGAAGSRPSVDGGLGAAAATPPPDEGIITVVPAAAAAAAGSTAASPSPSKQQRYLRSGSSSTSRASPLPSFVRRSGSRPQSPADCLDAADDPLLHHLAALQAQGAALGLLPGQQQQGSGGGGVGLRDASSRVQPAAAAIAAARRGGRGASKHQPKQQQHQPVQQLSTAAAAAAASSDDPDGLLAELATSQQLAGDTRSLAAAAASLLAEHQAWHAEQVAALTANQAYLTRTMDSAESKADKAVRHVQQQATKMKQVAAGLGAAEGLPLLVGQLAAGCQQLEAQLEALEARAGAPPPSSAAAFAEQ